MNKEALLIGGLCLAVAGGLMFLQVFLSKREKRWPGLIIPVIFFALGLISPLWMLWGSESITLAYIMEVLFAWIIGNIPTFIMIGIFYVVRGEMNRQERM